LPNIALENSSSRLLRIFYLMNSPIISLSSESKALNFGTMTQGKRSDSSSSMVDSRPLISRIALKTIILIWCWAVPPHQTQSSMAANRKKSWIILCLLTQSAQAKILRSEAISYIHDHPLNFFIFMYRSSQPAHFHHIHRISKNSMVDMKHLNEIIDQRLCCEDNEIKKITAT
jgi:hypothetical protein